MSLPQATQRYPPRLSSCAVCSAALKDDKPCRYSRLIYSCITPTPPIYALRKRTEKDPKDTASSSNTLFSTITDDDRFNDSLPKDGERHKGLDILSVICIEELAKLKLETKDHEGYYYPPYPYYGEYYDYNYYQYNAYPYAAYNSNAYQAYNYPSQAYPRNPNITTQYLPETHYPPNSHYQPSSHAVSNNHMASGTSASANPPQTEAATKQYTNQPPSGHTQSHGQYSAVNTSHAQSNGQYTSSVANPSHMQGYQSGPYPPPSTGHKYINGHHPHKPAQSQPYPASNAYTSSHTIRAGTAQNPYTEASKRENVTTSTNPLARYPAATNGYNPPASQWPKARDPTPSTSSVLQWTPAETPTTRSAVPSAQWNANPQWDKGNQLWGAAGYNWPRQ
jgi:hypothetical protein